MLHLQFTFWIMGGVLNSLFLRRLLAGRNNKKEEANTGKEKRKVFHKWIKIGSNILGLKAKLLCDDLNLSNHC